MILSTLSPTRFEDENFRMILAREVKNNVELFPMSLLDKQYDTYEWKHVLKSKANETKVGDTSAVRSCANLTEKKNTQKKYFWFSAEPKKMNNDYIRSLALYHFCKKTFFFFSFIRKYYTYASLISKIKVENQYLFISC